MPRIVDYYLSVQSPWTYLGHARACEVVARRGAEIRCKPVNFGEIFPLSGGLPLGKRAPQRQAYRLLELARWRDKLGLELNIHPAHFPAAEEAAALMVTAAGEGQGAAKLAGAVLQAVWAEERDIGDPQTLSEIAAACGFDADKLRADSQQDDIRARYQANTREAIDRGVFGAPTFILDDVLFWGQDRIEFLDLALA